MTNAIYAEIAYRRIRQLKSWPAIRANSPGAYSCTVNDFIAIRRSTGWLLFAAAEKLQLGADETPRVPGLAFHYVSE